MRAVPYAPRPNAGFDMAMLACCAIIGVFLVGIVAIAQFGALVKFWPYNLAPTLFHYDFDRKGGGGWTSYFNSIRLGLYTAVAGTAIVFVGAYVVEKARGVRWGRTAFQFLAMLPMAVPGMVLGLAYIFFFNDPRNPLNGLYRTMAILVVNTVVHFYTVAHLTALTALKQMDPEFETVSMSLRQPVYRTFWRVTVPISLPAILDTAMYLFVNAMATVSGRGVPLRAPNGAGVGRGPEHGRRRGHRGGGGDGDDDLLHQRGRPGGARGARAVARAADPGVAAAMRDGSRRRIAGGRREHSEEEKEGT